MIIYLFIVLLSELGWLSAAELAQFSAQNSDLNSQWVDLGPNPNDTANSIFNTVYSLTMGWPNRRYRNGHTIIPGVLPVGTYLYHGRGDSRIPDTPEWTALDFELSSLYCGLFSLDDKGCWHLTLVVERPLRVLFFDGYSALKFPGGTVDSQDVVAWNRVIPQDFKNEPQRIADLCHWGESFGIQGFVRLHTSHEVMLCDFSKGLKVDSMLHVKVPYKFPLPPPPNSSLYATCQGPPANPPPEMQIGIPFDAFGLGELLASKRIDTYPGETRVQLHLHRLVSFYDLSIAPSLAPQRVGQHRLQHRILGISQSDIDIVKARLEEELADARWTNPVSGIDWQSFFHTIVQRYADHLELIQLDLNSTRSPEDISSTLRTTFLQLRGMIQPYDLFSARPINGSKGDTSWATPVYKACATAHTRFISLSTSLTSSERLMVSSAEVVNREICRIITKVWADGVNSGVEERQHYNPESMHSRWKQDIDDLMSWLDWSVWIKCKPACSYDEMCYLPISPYLVPGADPEDEWIVQASDPHPTCISKHAT